MKKYTSGHWQLDLPDNWESEAVDDAVSFYDPESNGTLLFSTVEEEETITDEYLAEMIEEHIEAGADFYEVEFGPFSGVTCCYVDEQEYWCEWYLTSGSILLLVTYNCPLAEEGAEDDVIEIILESLQQPAPH